MLIALVIGLAVGSIYGLTSMGLVLTYRTSGVFNLAHGAMGMFGAFVFWQLWQDWGWPMLPSLVVAVGLVAPLLGVAAHFVVFRWVYDKPVVIGIVGGIALLVTFQGLANVIWGPVPRSLPSLFPFHAISVTHDFNMTTEQLGTIGVTVAVGAVLLWYLQRTHLGLQMRAVVDDHELVEITGARSELVKAIAWAVAAAMATLSGILISPFIQLDLTGLTLVVVQAMAAAVLGRLTSLPLAFAGGLALGVLEAVLGWYLPESLEGIRTSAAFLVLYGAIVLGALRFRFFPEVTTALPTGLLGRGVSPKPLLPLLATGAVLALLIPSLSSYMLILITGALIASIAFQGFVLVTGLGGEVVLCQAAFVGLGALLYSQATVERGAPILIGIVLAVGLTTAFGLLIALPATRIRGLPLALLTLAFGLFADNFLFQQKSIGGGFGGYTLARPDVFGLDLENNRVFAYFVLVISFAIALAVRNLASGRTGRMLVAAKNAPVAVEAFGASVRNTKLLVFLMGNALAAFAGILLAWQLGAVAAIQFNVGLSILYLAVAVLGGVGTAQGALIGGLLLYGGPDALARFGGDQWQQAFFGVGAVLVLMAARGGVADILSRPLIRLSEAFRSGPPLAAGAMTAPRGGQPVGRRAIVREPAAAIGVRETT